MRKLGGLRFGCKLVQIWRCKKYLRFRIRARSDRSVAAKLVDWGRSITRRLRGGGVGGDYYRLGDVDPVAPKGHLAVYVGGGKREGGPPQRYLVPVIYFNHPLFGELLREAEAEFGYEHPGGITIPCPVAKFERVQTRIANAEPGRKSTRL